MSVSIRPALGAEHVATLALPARLPLLARLPFASRKRMNAGTMFQPARDRSFPAQAGAPSTPGNANQKSINERSGGDEDDGGECGPRSLSAATFRATLSDAPRGEDSGEASDILSCFGDSNSSDGGCESSDETCSQTDDDAEMPRPPPGKAPARSRKDLSSPKRDKLSAGGESSGRSAAQPRLRLSPRKKRSKRQAGSYLSESAASRISAAGYQTRPQTRKDEERGPQENPTRCHAKRFRKTRHGGVSRRLKPSQAPTCSASSAGLLPFGENKRGYIAWTKKLAQLKEFIADNGRYPKYRDKIDGAASLAQWCGHQRYIRNRGALSAKRQQILNEVPDWSWESVHDRKWNENYSALLNYVERYGTLPDSAVVYYPERNPVDGARGPGLFAREAANGRDDSSGTAEGSSRARRKLYPGRWCAIQRLRRKNGLLSLDRQKKLDAIEVWQWKLPGPKTLTDWQQPRATCGASGGAEPVRQANPRPSARSAGDRGQPGGDTRVDGDEAPRKDASKPTTCAPGTNIRERQWETQLGLLKKFVEEYGELPKKKAVYGGVALGQWCGNQRQIWRKKKMLRERARRLETEVPGWTWNPAKTGRWHHMLDVLRQYVDHANELPGANDVFCSTRDAYGQIVKVYVGLPHRVLGELLQRAASHLSAESIQIGEWYAFRLEARAAGELSAKEQEQLDEILSRRRKTSSAPTPVPNNRPWPASE